MIGINAQIRSDQGNGSGIGFAVPAGAARRSLHEVLTKGRVAYAYAGLQTETLTPALAHHLGLPVGYGALIDSVTAGGPGARAGLRGGNREEQFQGEAVLVGGDVVVSVAGRSVRSADDLVRIVTNSLRPGRTAVFRVVRAGSQRAITVRLAARVSR